MPDLLNTYSQDQIRDALENFLWKGADRQQGWAQRMDLSKGLGAALDDPDHEGLLRALKAIHTWGLPGKFPESVTLKIGIVRELLKNIRAGGPTVEALVGLLAIEGVGIATISKWICFLDQSRYAIYDSRVSVALRMVRDENKHRCFPVMPRRPSRVRTPWPEDRVIAASMASYYLRYLDCVRAAAEQMPLTAAEQKALTPAEVEMALFMIGNLTCDDPAGWRRGRGSLQAP